MPRSKLAPPHPRLKPLRRIKGGWTAGGHNFDDGMRCFLCRRTWLQHQRAPDYCRDALAELRKRDRDLAA